MYRSSGAFSNRRELAATRTSASEKVFACVCQQNFADFCLLPQLLMLVSAAVARAKVINITSLAS